MLVPPIRSASLSNSFKFIKKSLQTLFSCSQTQTAAPYHRIPKYSHPNNTQISTHHPAETCNMSNPRKMIKNRIDERDREMMITGERLVVAAKLKELVMMDRSNVDLVLDIEEVLHYYSRLRCPVYLDLFHKFFMELCSEFAACSTPSSGPNKLAVGRSRPKCRTIGR